MYTLSNLPAHGIVYLFVTADRVTEESAQNGDAEERGWVREVGSREIYENRNYVAPTAQAEAWDLAYGPDREDERADLRAVVESLGAYYYDGRGTYYGEDGQVDDATGDTFNYAVHVFVKHLDGGRWAESPVDVMARVSLVKA